MGVTHTMVSGKSDGADASLVRPSDWNAAHTNAEDDDYEAAIILLLLAS